MSQQTQISRVLSHLDRFLDQFPTIADLAEASPATVITAWSGLGYNRRARALQEAARIVVRDHGGELPRDVATLRSLPGIGPYTAASVVVFAFGGREPVVDTNIRRVLGRSLLGRSDATDADVTPLMRDLLRGRAAPHRTVQALMDLGALHCVARVPNCVPCPLQSVCTAAQGGIVAAVPRAKQAAFEGSNRQERGRVLRVLASTPSGLTVDALDTTVLDGLLRDGLIERRGSRVGLPRA